MNYPKRGTKSEDGKLYTDNNGGVYNVRRTKSGETHFRIEGAFVPTDDVIEACEAMRAGIIQCSLHATGFEGCRSVIAPCHLLTENTCPLRAYLAKHGQADAWEVKQ